MTGPTDVIAALTPPAEDAIADAIFAATAPYVLRASLVEADELEAHAAESAACAVLVSPDLPGLTPGHCARLRGLGFRLVGVALDDSAAEQLERLGIDAIVSPDPTVATLAAALAGDATSDFPAASAAEPPAIEGWFASEQPEAGAAGRGSLLAVIGGKGAPGASECASSLAAVAGQLWSSVLVELDALGGGLFLRLGVDPNAGSLLAAARAARERRPVAELLERWLVRSPGWPPVLLGPPEPGRALPELAQPGLILAALAGLTRSFALTVCDVGWPLDPVGEGLAARLHREVAVAADSVLLLIGCRDEQVRSGLAQLDQLLGEPRHLA